MMRRAILSLLLVLGTTLGGPADPLAPAGGAEFLITAYGATDAKPAFPLKLSANRRYLVDQRDKPFFILADTPWFIQKLKIEDVRMLMDDRVAKGFNALFLELLDDSRIPSRDGYGNVAFETNTDITRPVEAYWRYAEQVLDEAEKRGHYRWMITPSQAPVFLSGGCP